MTISTPMFCTDQSYPFEDLRLVLGALGSPGVISAGDMLVSPASGLQVQVAAGRALVPQIVATEGSFYATGTGLYYVVNDAAASPYNTILAPSASPRVDTVVLRVYDVNEQGLTGSSFARLEWVSGSETAGANVTPGSSGFLAGAAAVPANSLVLAYVLQTVGESSISSGNILNVTPVSGKSLWTPIMAAAGMQSGYPSSGTNPAMVRMNGVTVEMKGYLSATGAFGTFTTLATFPTEFSPSVVTGDVFSEVIPFNWNGGTTLLIISPGSPCSLSISTAMSPGEQICLSGVDYRQGL